MRQASSVITPLEEKLSEAETLASTKEKQDQEVAKVVDQAEAKRKSP